MLVGRLTRWLGQRTSATVAAAFFDHHIGNFHENRTAFVGGRAALQQLVSGYGDWLWACDGAIRIDRYRS